MCKSYTADGNTKIEFFCFIWTTVVSTMHVIAQLLSDDLTPIPNIYYSLAVPSESHFLVHNAVLLSCMSKEDCRTCCHTEWVP